MLKEFKLPSARYKIETGAKWMGPCSDSFCYATCNAAHCCLPGRLGNTPDEHNAVLAQMKAQELAAARKLVAEADEIVPLHKKLENILTSK